MLIIRKSIFLLPFFVVAWFTSCTHVGQEVEPTQQTTYVTLNIGSLRSHGDDTEDPGFTNPNTDPEHNEDRIEELRMIAFPVGEANASLNLKFDAASIVNNRITFKVSEPRAYDIYLLANESASGQAATQLAFLQGAAVSRNELETTIAKVDMVGIVPEQMGSGVNGTFMMTAVYKNVSFSRSLPGTGSQSDPHRIDLSAQNLQQRPQVHGTDRKSAEMMRSLAKLEITLKDIVEISPNGSGGFSYDWILPYGYTPNSRLKVELLNMPKKYTLFPRPQLTDISLVGGAIQNYVFSFSTAPDPKAVILPPEVEPSIGGILTADYKLYVYLPEYLAAKTLAENQKPGVKISYYEEGVAGVKDRFYPIENDGPTHYDNILEEPGIKDQYSKLWSVFRNRLYKMTVNVKGK